MKLPILKSKDAVRILKKAGFYIDHQSGGHVTMLNDFTKKRVTIPFHAKDIKKGTLHGIIKQSGLSLEEFVSLR